MKDIDISRQKIWDDGGFKEITIEFADEYNTKLDNSNIYNESVELTETLCDESNIKYGKCSANCFKVTIFNDSTISHKGIKIHPKLTINPNTDNADTIELGYYTIESEEKSSDKMYRNIVAYDDMYKIANTDVAEWYNGLTFPMTIKAFRDSFFAWFGITQKETTLPLDSLTISKTLDVKTISGLSVIESICELNGCFGNINWDGQFEYIYISSEDDALYPDDELYPSDDLYTIGNFDLYLNKSDYVQGSLTYEDFTSQALTSVTIRNSQDEAGATYPTVTDPKTNYVITNNFLVSDKGTETLSAIAEKFYLENHDVSYTPFNIKTFAKPWAELGDNANIITNDGAIKTVILKRTLRGITALFDSLSASGEPNFSNSINSIANDIENLKGKSNILTRTLEETRSEITDLETNTSSTISQLSNQISAKVDNGDYTASVIIGKINDDTQSGVQIDADKINLNGYVTVTDLKTSGQTIINGSNITTGEINCDRLNGGTISGQTIVSNERTFLTQGKPGLFISEDGFDFCFATENSANGTTYNHIRMTADGFNLLELLSFNGSTRLAGANIGKYLTLAGHMVVNNGIKSFLSGDGEKIFHYTILRKSVTESLSISANSSASGSISVDADSNYEIFAVGGFTLYGTGADKCAVATCNLSSVGSSATIQYRVNSWSSSSSTVKLNVIVLQRLTT